MADGIQATDAYFGIVTALAFDKAGNLLLGKDEQIRRVDKVTHIVTTVVDGTGGIVSGIVVTAAGTTSTTTAMVTSTRSLPAGPRPWCLPGVARTSATGA